MYTILDDNLTMQDLIDLDEVKDMKTVIRILRRLVVVDDGRDVAELHPKHLKLIMKAIAQKMADDSVGN